MRVLFPPRRVLQKSPITFFDQLKIQKPTRLWSTQKIWISKFSEFQEFWWEFCFPHKELYQKALWHFSINSKSKNIHNFKVPKKFRIAKFSEFQELRWEFWFPPEEFYQKALWHFSINSKSKNIHDFKVPKKFQNFQSSRSSDESSVSPPKSSIENPYDIFRATQNPKI